MLEVGTGLPYPAPSAAAAEARDGDTVRIAPGTYYDCAVWRADRLTITGDPTSEGGAVLSDRACEDKAAFVVRGDAVTLRGLTFTRIRVPDGNGAGVRAEGRDLTVTDSRFVNDQDGILAAGGGFLRIVGCTFSDGGAGDARTHAVLAGHLDVLRIEGSTFAAARGGDHVSAAAARTELLGNHFADSARLTGPLVAIAGGAILVEGNTVALGDAARPGAILVVGDALSLSVRGNTLTAPEGSALVRNWGGVAATESGNTVSPGSVAVSDSGSTWHRFRADMAVLRDRVRAALGAVRHLVAALARFVGVLR